MYNPLSGEQTRSALDLPHYITLRKCAISMLLVASVRDTTNLLKRRCYKQALPWTRFHFPQFPQKDLACTDIMAREQEFQVILHTFKEVVLRPLQHRILEWFLKM